MSDNLFIGNVVPDGYIQLNTTNYIESENVKTSLPMYVSRGLYYEISPVGGTSIRARTIEILIDGSARWYGDFGISESNPMILLHYIPRSDVAAIQIYYHHSTDTCTGLSVIGSSASKVQLTRAVMAHRYHNSLLPRFVGVLELDVDERAERVAVLDRKSFGVLLKSYARSSMKLIMPVHYGLEADLLVLMFDDDGEFNAVVIDGVKAEIIDVHLLDVISIVPRTH